MYCSDLFNFRFYDFFVLDYYVFFFIVPVNCTELELQTATESA